MKYSTASALLLFKTQIRKYYEVRLHSLYRVPGFPSSRPNWVPHPLTHKGVLLPPFQKGETHSLVGEGGPNSDEGTDTLLIYVNYSTSKLESIAYLSSTEFSKPNILDCWIHKPGT